MHAVANDHHPLAGLFYWIHPINIVKLQKKLLIVCRDYNDFLEDLEEDPSYRQNINIYKGWSSGFYYGALW